jgi:branched-chain amino acid aminotransferase
MTVTHFWINNELVPIVDAKVSVLDHGFTVADGVFETLLVTDGKVFALDRHLTRLARSASGLGIAMPDVAAITNGVSQVLTTNPKVDFGRLRITITSGSGPLGSDRTATAPTLVISLAEQAAWPATTKVLLVPWSRNERLKTTSYAENVYALDAAKAQGFSEAIFCDTSGRLCEGTGSNIFLVKDDQIFTPSEASGLLRGITRDLVIEWATESGFVIVERDVDPMELWDADEVFITSSTRDIHPVAELAKLDKAGNVVDRRTLVPGLVTEKLGNIFMTQRVERFNP